MANFFIQRPVFAGTRHHFDDCGLAILKLPVAQYPTIAPPAVAITATPRADVQTGYRDAGYRTEYERHR